MAGVKRNLVIRAGVDITNFSKNIGKMQKQLYITRKKITDLAKTATTMFTAPVAALTALTVKTVAYADEVATLATKANMSAESFQKWNYIAMQTDVETERLTRAFTKFRSAVGEILIGNTNQATEALNELGFSMEMLRSRSPEDNFDMIIRKLSEIKEPALQAAYANKIFSERVAQDLLPLFEAGGEAIEQYSEEFRKSGYLTNEQVEVLAEFDNQMNEVKNTVKVVSANLGIALLPILENILKVLQAVTPILQKVADFFTSLPAPIQNVATAGMLLLASLGPMLFMYEKLLMLKTILVGWYKAATIAKIMHTAAVNKETAATMAENAAKNANLLTMIKGVAVYAASKVAIVAKTVALKAYTVATKLATAAQTLLNAAFVASPIGWVILGIGALVTAFVLLWKKLEGFREFWKNLWEGIKNAFVAVVNFLIDGFNMYLKAWKFLINGVISLANKAIKGLNKIPGVNIKLIPKLDENALQIPKLAKGGIAYGNAIVNVGEYQNARTNPEVIAPLDKLQGLIGDREQTININLDGRTVAQIVLDRSGRLIKQIGGV